MKTCMFNFATFLVAVIATSALAENPPATQPGPTTQSQPAAQSQPAVQPSSPSKAEILKQIADLELYEPTLRSSGTIRVIATSPITHMLHNWAAEYGRLQPMVKIDIQSGSSDEMLPALNAGRVDFAALSRPATANDLAAFKAKHGYELTKITVGIGAVAVYVNHVNPLNSISLTQLDAVYSRVPMRGGAKIEAWGALGLKGPWKSMVPSRFGRSPNRADTDLFTALVLRDGEFRLDIREERMASSLVQGVGADASAIGYASIAYITPAVKALELEAEDGVAYPLTRETCLNGKYPLARRLELYFNRPPRKPLSELHHDFAWFMISHFGQQIVGQAGLFPIDGAIQLEGRSRLE